MDKMFKDFVFWCILALYFIGLTGIIYILISVFALHIIPAFLIGFILSGFALIGISLILIKEESDTVTESTQTAIDAVILSDNVTDIETIEQTDKKPTEYNYDDLKPYLEEW